MADSQNQPPNDASLAAGMPYYEKQRQNLHRMLNKRQLLERNLANIEDNIMKKELEYLEDTPMGNIITGFEAYTKGTIAAPGQKKKVNVPETSKVFSRSSITFTAHAYAETPIETASSTPMAAMAPTPLSTAFVKGENGSNHPTPTSSKSGAGKKNKKGATGDDSDTDARESKKARTHFGAQKK